MQATNSQMSAVARAVFWFVAVNALAGALSLMLFPTRTDTLFFWEIKPAINASLFGALYLGGAATVAWVTYRGAWETARFLVPILVTAGVLISATTFLHLDRFEPGVKLLYWLVIYVGAPLLALALYAQHERAGADWGMIEPVRPAVRSIALALGGVLVAGGLAILIWPGALVMYWPWPISTLMLRIFASWFSAFGAGLLWFLVERDWRRVRHVADLMVAAAVADLLMVVIYRGDLTSAGLSLWIYCFHLAVFGLAGLLMRWLQRKAVLAARRTGGSGWSVS
ncbi:MAG TPA: hypothetical protein VFU22_00390 [Roseiflexaceae bacterium]|nr:hypothetical protein [Roseiflexaceae bacterium]